jgi:hypothetical protein
MPDKVLREKIEGVIRIDGLCYEFESNTLLPVDTHPSEVEGVFSNCHLCRIFSSSSSLSSSSGVPSSSSNSSSSSSNSVILPPTYVYAAASYFYPPQTVEYGPASYNNTP